MNPDQWDRFGRVLGDETLRTEPRFATNDARLANHEEMKTRIEAALSGATTAEWVRRFEEASIASGPIYEFDEVLADPQVLHLGLVTEVEQPAQGRVRMLGFPFRAPGASTGIRRPAPLLGQHTAEVLEELGLTRSDIDRLADTGVVARAEASTD
jgi:crotonobetainyl-CoA:carnitine CoA-transferase CaiB-like acyl-CoA transferase